MPSEIISQSLGGIHAIINGRNLNQFLYHLSKSYALASESRCLQHQLCQRQKFSPAFVFNKAMRKHSALIFSEFNNPYKSNGPDNYSDRQESFFEEAERMIINHVDRSFIFPPLTELGLKIENSSSVKGEIYEIINSCESVTVSMRNVLH